MPAQVPRKTGAPKNRPFRQTALAIGIAAMAFASAACGNTTDDLATNQTQVPTTTASTTADVVEQKSDATASSDDKSSAIAPVIEELPFAYESTTTSTKPKATSAETATSAKKSEDAATASSTTTPGASSSPPATSAPGTPVTTVSGGGGGDVASYFGVLGRIGHDQLITPAVAPAPVAAPNTFPLTGHPGSSPNRPAAVVKIDNGSRARPQTGLNLADIVVEEEVEGGITRFAAIFHSQSTVVGPIRSARTTDLGIINGLGSPLLMYSGANKLTDAIIRSQPTVQNRNAGTSSGYWRNSSRRAPSNLYSDTGPHWASATGGPPPPQFAFRSPGEAVTKGGVADTSLTVSYRANVASWDWNGSAWLRSQGGRPHMTASGERVSAANVVVIEAREVATGMTDSSGSVVPEFVFVGTAKATVFTSGQRIEGIWTRPTLSSVATLTTASGDVIELTPGRTWVELIRENAGMLQ